MTQHASILITDAHEPAALGIIRALGRAGHRVTAACPRRFGRPAAAWSRHCAAFRFSPDPWRDQTLFRLWLDKQLAEVEFDAALPLSDAALAALAAVRAQAPPDIRLLLPGEGALACALGARPATRKALELGLPCPNTVFIEPEWSDEELERRLGALQCPLVLRFDPAPAPSGAYLPGRSPLAATPAEALRLLREPGAAHAPCLAQEWRPGERVEALYLRQGGEIRLQFAQRRGRALAGAGPERCESLRDEALLAAGRLLLVELDYEGAARVSFLRDPRGGPPRFWGLSARLGPAIELALACGVDFPRAMLEGAQSPAPDAPRPGGWPEGRSHRGGSFHWSDPLPALAPALRHIDGLARRAGGRIMKPIQEREALGRGETIRQRQAALTARWGERPPRRLLFFCLGNICRSPFAEGYWNLLRSRPGGAALPEATSAGFYPQDGRPTPPWFQAVAAEFGVSLAAHRSHCATQLDIDAADALFVMDRGNERDLAAAFPQALEKMSYLGPFGEDCPLEIADPFQAGEAEARACYRQIAAALEGLAAALARARA